MLAITCDKCRRRFTPTTEDLQGYLALAQGRKPALARPRGPGYTLVTCPHCGKGNKVATQRVEQALRFSPAPPAVGAPTTTQPGPETDDQ